jgi:hypothetical protein
MHAADYAIHPRCILARSSYAYCACSAHLCLHSCHDNVTATGNNDILVACVRSGKPGDWAPPCLTKSRVSLVLPMPCCSVLRSLRTTKLRCYRWPNLFPQSLSVPLQMVGWWLGLSPHRAPISFPACGDAVSVPSSSSAS